MRGKNESSDIICTKKSITVRFVKWSFCAVVTAFQETSNWNGDDPEKDNLNDQSNVAVAMWRTDYKISRFQPEGTVTMIKD